MKETRPTSPPRADLAFRVGIVGHRPNRLPQNEPDRELLRLMLRSFLEAVKVEMLQFARPESASLLYSGNPAVLRAVTPLAEGTDRIFGEEAIKLSYQIVCPMPFTTEEYEKDFEPPYAFEDNSRTKFRNLLKQARDANGLTIFELDGDRKQADAAYGAAGRIVLNQSDVLIAVWDGCDAAGGGGTLGTMQEAVRYHVPVVWIDAQEPQRWQFLRSAADLPTLGNGDRCIPHVAMSTDSTESQRHICEIARRVVLGEIDLIEENQDDHSLSATQSQARQYFRETKPKVNLAIAWKLFRNAVGSARFEFPQIRIPDFEDHVGKEWPTKESADDSSSHDNWLNRLLRPHFAWADRRADLYADAYRSAYVLTYLLSATAVFMALLPYAMAWTDERKIICVGVELAILITIILLLAAGRAKRWHERWLEYRLLAELIRQLRMLIPLGGGRPFPRLPSHLGGYGAPSQTWMYWHMRAIARATGIPQTRVTPEYTRACLDHLAMVVDGPAAGQREFHKDTAARARNISHRLHFAATALFVLTIATVLMHGLLELPAVEHALSRLPLEIPGSVGRWLVLASATLPAFAAALAGISNHGEFARVAKRSAAMANICKIHAEQIAALRSGADGALKLSHVIPLASSVAGVMVEEVADWRAVFIDRPQVAA